MQLHGKKRHVRAILIERVQLQHDMRVLERHSSPFTLTDKLIIDDLLKMSLSAYTEVVILLLYNYELGILFEWCEVLYAFIYVIGWYKIGLAQMIMLH